MYHYIAQVNLEQDNKALTPGYFNSVLEICLFFSFDSLNGLLYWLPKSPNSMLHKLTRDTCNSLYHIMYGVSICSFNIILSVGGGGLGALFLLRSYDIDLEL